MTLKEWMKEDRRTATWLAGLLGVTVGSVSRYSRRVSDPSLKTAVEIVKITGGLVTCEELLKLPEEA